MISSYVLQSRIEQRAGALTPSERKIADYVLQNQSKIGDLSIAQLAKQIGSSPATIVRFCRSIGFDGYNDFKSALAASGAQEYTGLFDLHPDDPVQMIRQKVLLLNKCVMEAATVSHNDREFELVASLLTAAPRVVMFGTGGSGCSVKSAYDMFLHLGIRCEYVVDPIYEIITIANMKPGDVIFTICHSGRTRNTYENLKFARSNGITVIGLVGTQKSPLDLYLDHKIVTGTLRQDYFSSTLAARISELHAISILYSIIVLRNRNLDKQYANYLDDVSEIKRLQIGKLKK